MMKPLEGLKVLDLTQLNGFTTMELADYGADVVKIERPDFGDSVRFWPPLVKGQSPYNAFLNRGKKSIGLDLKSEEGKAVLKDLVKEADILVENFKVGTMEKYGLGYEVLEAINPGLIYAQLTGYGSTGPMKDYPAFDILAQAQTGLMDITGFPTDDPSLIGFAIGDHYSTLFLSSGIMMALMHKERTGQGQKVEVSMLEALFAITEDKVCNYYIGREFPTRVGNAHPLICPYDVLEAKNGYCAVGVSTDAQWKKFCIALDIEYFLEIPEYMDNVTRGQHYFGDLRDKLVEITTQYPKEELAQIIINAGIPAAAVNTIEEAMNQEQLKVRNMLVEVEDQILGKIKMPNRTIRFKDEGAHEMKGAPMLGQDTEEILKSLGYDDEKIKELASKNIIKL